MSFKQPIKNANLQEFKISNFMEDPVFEATRHILLANNIWSLRLHADHEAIWCAIEPVQFGLFSDDPRYMMQISIVNQSDPTKHYGYRKGDGNDRGRCRWPNYYVCHRQFGRGPLSYEYVSSHPEEFLKNGEVIVRVELRVDYIVDIRDERRINHFNFWDPRPADDTFTFSFSDNDEERKLYVSKQLLRFHSPYFNQLTNHRIEIRSLDCQTTRDQFEKVLQLAHGVQLDLDGDTSLNHDVMFALAGKFQLRNVLYQFEKREIRENEDLSILSVRMYNAIDYNLLNLFTHCINEAKTPEDFAELMQNHSNFEDYSPDMLKAVDAKYNAFN